ncbi:TspO/MBR-related protein [Auriculariales sp. MPI-PUGE-AT-0066]|nr:TspO/MBR-related protein [Auriculariales sp. MPI-PUGE-AT-0066]
MALQLPPLLLNAARNPALAICIPLISGWASGYPTGETLTKPPLYPPALAFPVVWTGLYIGMGWASHLAVAAVDKGRAGAELGLALYYTQMVLNVAWTPLFFGMKRPDLALLDIVPLTGTVWYMTSLLHTATDGATTPFLAPYCAWLAFATYLNAGIWNTNRSRVISKDD